MENSNPNICRFVFVCNGKDCKKKGSKELVKVFKQEIEARKISKSTRVIKTKCTDHCKKAPIVIMGEELHFKMSRGGAAELAHRYFDDRRKQ